MFANFKIFQVLVGLLTIPCSALESQTILERHVIGGIAVTDPEKYPFAAFIYFTDKTICGSAIIAEDKLLSAAHCFHTNGKIKNVEDIAVYAGCLLPDPIYPNQSGKCQKADVRQVVIHPEFQYSNTNKHNDIAIIHLSSALRFDRTVERIQIWENDIMLPEIGTLIGWGKTEQPENGQLNEVNVPIFQKEECQNKSVIITDKQLCAGGVGQGACSGDSGSPLLCHRGNIHYLCGILSFGKSKCNATNPDGYTNPSVYVDWINSMSPNNHNLSNNVVILTAILYIVRLSLL